MGSTINFFVKKQPKILQRIFYRLIPFKFRYGKKFRDFLKLIEKSKKWTYEESKNYQFSEIKRVLKYVNSEVPYYQNLFKKIGFDIDIKSFEDLKKIPILTKEDILKNPEEFISKSYTKKKYKMNTSGTTGKKLTLYGSDDLFKIECAFITNSFRSHGAKLYDKHSVWIRRYSPKENEPIYFDDLELNRSYMSAFHLNDDTIKSYVDYINKTKSEILVSYPSTLYYLSVLCNKHNLKLKYIKHLHGASEVCLPQWSRKIEEYLGLQIKMHYGQVEKVSFAHQDSEDNYYRENLLYGYNEFLEDGSIISTGFHNEVMPLIRYETKDNVELLADPILDGAFPKTIKRILGRDGDMLLTEKDSWVPAVNFYSFMSKVDEVDLFQIIQKREDKSITFYIVPNQYYNNLTKEKLIEEMKSRLGEVPLKIEVVSELTRDSNSSKLKTVCCI
jgi:phenylacetate-CoA ligase